MVFEEKYSLAMKDVEEIFRSHLPKKRNESNTFEDQALIIMPKVVTDGKCITLCNLTKVAKKMPYGSIFKRLLTFSNRMLEFVARKNLTQG